ncbi:MAG: DUF2283 domain-containing protein [Deltaproteobacteria bacterium]|nr:DUF2283 domain-containing protein [Deltaproteobacteria bacterium]
MDKKAFFETEIIATDGTPVRLVYDREADILEIFFGQNEPGTGVELTEHILLRVNLQTRQPISVTILHFSILTEHTEYGPRSYALEKLIEVPEDLRELVLHMLNAMPVRQFLKVTHFQASPTKQIPVTYVESQPALNAA